MEQNQSNNAIVRKAYISGKISGTVLAQTKQRFVNLQSKLESLGYVVINPFHINDVDVDNHTKTWQECLRLDIKHLMDCDELHLLPCWSGSRGATLERHIALSLGMEVVYH